MLEFSGRAGSHLPYKLVQCLCKARTWSGAQTYAALGLNENNARIAGRRVNVVDWGLGLAGKRYNLQISAKIEGRLCHPPEQDQMGIPGCDERFVIAARRLRLATG
jgi:hypothetical protein